MIIANVRVNLSSAETMSCISIPKNAVGLKVCFQYDDPLWKKLSKTAVFRNSTRTVNSILTNDCAVIPHELLNKTKDTIYVGLYGTDSSRSIGIPTVWAKLGEVSSSATPSSSVTSEATLPHWVQIQEKVNSLEKEMMVQEDLDRALLQAKESGAFDGPQGPKGEQGEQGETGPAGYAPILGTDYWTAEDKQTITAEAANIAANAIQHSSDIICTTTGSLISLNDASNRELHGLKLYGKTIQNGTPTPETPVPLEFAGADGTIIIKLGISETDESQQILTVQTPNGLPGIPVTSGGNYTDENRQMWICDEIDFARGKYVQRLAVHKNVSTFSGTPYVNNVGTFIAPVKSDVMNISGSLLGAVMCDKLPTITGGSQFQNNISGISSYSGKLFISVKDITTLEEITEWIQNNPITIVYEQKKLIETDLTAEEIAQYSALHTNYPNTTIYNDGGAGMEVSYVADTKLYIDRRINELTATE